MSHNCLSGWQRFKSRWLPATKSDLNEMEYRLTEVIARQANITPSIGSAAMSVQSALDKLDASIPDKQ